MIIIFSILFCALFAAEKRLPKVVQIVAQTSSYREGALNPILANPKLGLTVNGTRVVVDFPNPYEGTSILAFKQYATDWFDWEVKEDLGKEFSDIWQDISGLEKIELISSTLDDWKVVHIAVLVQDKPGHVYVAALHNNWDTWVKDGETVEVPMNVPRWDSCVAIGPVRQLQMLARTDEGAHDGSSGQRHLKVSIKDKNHEGDATQADEKREEILKLRDEKTGLTSYKRKSNWYPMDWPRSYKTGDIFGLTIIGAKDGWKPDRVVVMALTSTCFDPYSELACESAAVAQNFKMGVNGMPFASRDYAHKGCRYYESTSEAFYGLGGNETDMRHEFDGDEPYILEAGRFCARAPMVQVLVNAEDYMVKTDSADEERKDIELPMQIVESTTCYEATKRAAKEYGTITGYWMAYARGNGGVSVQLSQKFTQSESTTDVQKDIKQFSTESVTTAAIKLETEVTAGATTGLEATASSEFRVGASSRKVVEKSLMDMSMSITETTTKLEPPKIMDDTDMYVLWVWSIMREDNMGGTSSLTSLTYKWKWGECRDIPPQCVPGECLDSDPNCITCRTNEMMIDPDYSTIYEANREGCLPVEALMRCNPYQGNAVVDCCTPDKPCAEGEGDCDTDDDCQGDLVCYHNMLLDENLWWVDTCQRKQPKSIIDPVNPHAPEDLWGHDIFDRPTPTVDVVAEAARFVTVGYGFGFLGVLATAYGLFAWTKSALSKREETYNTIKEPGF